MSYLRITVATWKIDLNSAEGRELIGTMEQEGTPLLLRQPGFVRCQIIVPDAHTTVHLEEWASGDYATAGTKALMQWVQDSGQVQQLDGRPQSYSGAIRVSS